MDPREQQIMKRVMGLSKPQTMMQQLSNFFVEEPDAMQDMIDGEGADANGVENQRKIKPCSVCKVQKMNHIVREYVNSHS